MGGAKCNALLLSQYFFAGTCPTFFGIAMFFLPQPASIRSRRECVADSMIEIGMGFTEVYVSKGMGQLTVRFSKQTGMEREW